MEAYVPPISSVKTACLTHHMLAYVNTPLSLPNVNRPLSKSMLHNGKINVFYIFPHHLCFVAFSFFPNIAKLTFCFPLSAGKEESVATFKGNEFFTGQIYKNGFIEIIRFVNFVAMHSGTVRSCAV